MLGGAFVIGAYGQGADQMNKPSNFAGAPGGSHDLVLNGLIVIVPSLLAILLALQTARALLGWTG
jgi:hypothetical protein